MFLIFLLLFELLIHKKFEAFIVDFSFEKDSDEICRIFEWIALVVLLTVEDVYV